MTDYAFFDTSAFTGSRDLQSTSWRKIVDGITHGALRAATSQITLLESARQAKELIDAKIAQISVARTALAALEIDVVLPIKPNASDIDRLLPDWLDANGFEVLPVPGVSHAEVLKRDIEVRAPFVRSGKGYRDTLLWHSFLEWVAGLPELTTSVYFITSNSHDFCSPKGGLRPELAAELPVGVIVEVLESPRDLTSKIDFAMASSIETVVTDIALRHLETALLNESLDSDLLTWYTAVEDVTVSGVLADDGDAQLIETYDGGTQVWTVGIPATLEVAGYVYKADLAGLDESLAVTDSDWNSHYAEVSGRVECTVVVQVRIEDDLETYEAEIQELQT